MRKIMALLIAFIGLAGRVAAQDLTPEYLAQCGEIVAMWKDTTMEMYVWASHSIALDDDGMDTAKPWVCYWGGGPRPR